MSSPRLSFVLLLAGTLAAGACSDPVAPAGSRVPPGISRSGGTGGGGGGAAGGGGGGGGGGGTISGVSILPTTPPAPDILLRESFGEGPDILRPTGGKGDAKPDFTNTALSGFWVEYPGSKNSAWITAPETGPTWKFCGGGDNTSTENPWELPSPLQSAFGGCAASSWRDPVAHYPTALMPVAVALPSGGYELSMEGYPAPIAGGYVAIGFTSSSAVTDNLTSAGSLWLRVADTTRFGAPLHYELRTGSLASGRILAAGDAGAAGWTHMAIRVSPTAGTVTLTFADAVVATVPFTMAAPKYLAFEGVGILDDLVLRR